MNSQRQILARRQTVVFFPQPLIVNAVSCFVQNAEKRAGKPMLVVPRGDSAIERTHAFAKRMGRYVKPAALELETDALGHVLAEASLHVDRIVSLEQRAVGAAGTISNCGDQRRQLFPQTLEDSFHVRRDLARLVAVEQRVVGTFREAQCVSFFSLQVDYRFQDRAKGLEIVVLASLLPALLA